MDFGILLSTLQASNKKKLLDFRTNFSSGRDSLGNFHGELKSQHAGSFSRISSWKHRQFIPFRGERSSQGKWPLLSFWARSKPKKRCSRDGNVNKYPLRTPASLRTWNSKGLWGFLEQSSINWTQDTNQLTKIIALMSFGLHWILIVFHHLVKKNKIIDFSFWTI